MIAIAPANPNGDAIKQLLQESKTIAVVGISDKPARDSHRVSAYMQKAGYRIIPVNPVLSQVLGEKCYPDLGSVPDPIDIVNIFRRSEYVPPLAEAAVALGAKALWLQLGVENAAAADLAHRAGLMVVQNACLMVYHRRLLG